MLHARPDYQRRFQDADNIIPEKEPVYLFRAQDVHASRVLRFYANLVAGDGGDHEVVRLTRDHADLMDAWPVKKNPDCP